MMDHIKIIKRAWQIVWSYRALWIFGLLLAFSGASRPYWPGNGGHGSGIRDNQQSFEITPGENYDEYLDRGLNDIKEGFDNIFSQWDISRVEVQTLIWAGVIFLIGMIILGVAIAVFRYVSETAVIRMVNDYEENGIKASLRQGFRYGWSRASWHLFLINILVNLPAFILVLVIALVGVAIYLLVSQSNVAITIAGSTVAVGFLVLVIFLVMVINAVLSLLRHFFWRACVLEQAGVRRSLSQGFALARENWKDVGLMWLIMIGLGIAWSVVSVLAFIVLIPVMLIAAIPGVIVAAFPLLAAAGITSIFLNGPLPWIVGAIYGLPWFLLITFAPLTFLQGLALIFNSSVWTLTYRELHPGTTPALEPESEHK